MMMIPFGRSRADKNGNKAPQESNKLTSVKRELTFLLWCRGVMAFVALATLAAGTAAWISISRDSGQRELQVTSDSADVQILSYNVYRSIWDEVALEYTYQDVTDQPFTLNGYDAVFGKNENTAAFLRVRLDGAGLTAGSTLTFHLTRANTSPEPNGETTNTNGLWQTSNSEAADYLSNIVYLCATQITSLAGQNNPGVIYPTANSYGTWSTPVMFAATAQDANNKTQFTGKNAETGGTSVTLTQSGPVEVFLKLDYQEDLVMGYINSRQRSGLVLRLDRTLSYDFTGDLTQLVVAVS